MAFAQEEKGRGGATRGEDPVVDQEDGVDLPHLRWLARVARVVRGGGGAGRRGRHLRVPRHDRRVPAAPCRRHHLQRDRPEPESMEDRAGEAEPVGTDPLFLGTYNCVAVGSNGDDLDLMAEPLPRGVGEWGRRPYKYCSVSLPQREKLGILARGQRLARAFSMLNG
uniref:Uncharacterized protein n=1 Tax=Ananas comosus var. bracteatus TaxID=296719 RepID=A0A6V7P4J8_ANACO|nr:unnamed protein product [Ananas comosus var. bracteatus]